MPSRELSVVGRQEQGPTQESWSQAVWQVAPHEGSVHVP